MTTVSRFFLAVLGFAYIGLGVWCSIAPQATSDSVGFVLQPGQGQSEFLTVYGGLEVALGLIFLWPLLKRDDTRISLAICLVVHSSLVLFRSIGFFIYTGFETTTYSLAATEWVIFLIAAILFSKSEPKLEE
ncbi:DUF4345 family protein [Thalassoglobus sp. JC818]|uniref:DUF4345 family protein n=1 Tax=Thalassoglobus sp. JC818 TaxID=3232136 RepID=UPI003459A87B